MHPWECAPMGPRCKQGLSSLSWPPPPSVNFWYSQPSTLCLLHMYSTMSTVYNTSVAAGEINIWFEYLLLACCRFRFSLLVLCISMFFSLVPLQVNIYPGPLQFRFSLLVLCISLCSHWSPFRWVFTPWPTADSDSLHCSSASRYAPHSSL